MSRQIVRTLSKHPELGTLVQLVEDSTNGRQYVIKRIMNLEMVPPPGIVPSGELVQMVQ